MIVAALAILAVAALIATVTLVAACMLSGQIDTKQAAMLKDEHGEEVKTI